MRPGKISPAYGHCQPTIDIFCGATALANVSKILCINPMHQGVSFESGISRVGLRDRVGD